MGIHAEIDIRMKENYEYPYRFKLTKRTPVIVRIDGRAFHTFTGGFHRPYDELLIKAMQSTCKYLCENVEGCVLGYTQSDEISLLLVDYKTFSSKPFFDYNIQKVCSITASMATLEFNRAFGKLVNKEQMNHSIELVSEVRAHMLAYMRGAMFDSRVFNIPKEEVTNYFYSRQIDARRNSVEMLGRANFSDKQLYKKNTDMIKEMLKKEYNVDWDELPAEKQMGSCCIKETYYIKNDTGEEVTLVTDSLDNNKPCAYYTKDGDHISLNEGSQRSRWVIDHNIPIFKDENRKYIDKLFLFDPGELS